jgi:hypothetical protein
MNAHLAKPIHGDWFIAKWRSTEAAILLRCGHAATQN